MVSYYTIWCVCVAPVRDDQQSRKDPVTSGKIPTCRGEAWPTTHNPQKVISNKLNKPALWTRPGKPQTNHQASPDLSSDTRIVSQARDRGTSRGRGDWSGATVAVPRRCSMRGHSVACLRCYEPGTSSQDRISQAEEASTTKGREREVYQRKLEFFAT